MRRKWIASCLLILMGASMAGAVEISNVEMSGGWYRFYDETGKRYKTASASSLGELKGFSATIIVFQRGGFIYVYDASLKRLFTGSVSGYGDVIAVAGSTFTCKRSGWIYTYNQQGKRLNTRPA